MRAYEFRASTSIEFALDILLNRRAHGLVSLHPSKRHSSAALRAFLDLVRKTTR